MLAQYPNGRNSILLPQVTPESIVCEVVLYDLLGHVSLSGAAWFHVSWLLNGGCHHITATCFPWLAVAAP